MRRRLPLLVALLLLALAAILMTLSEGPRPAKPKAAVSFPRWPRPAEVERARTRRTLPPLPAPAAEAEPEPARPRDPFLVALPSDASRPLVVLEANALRHSRIGELFVDCAVRAAGRDPFEEIRKEAGIDPLKDIDRVAFAQDGVVLSGFFDRARVDRLSDAARETRRGEHGRVFTPRDGGPEAPVVGLWRDQLLVVGPAVFVEGTLDRIEGPEPEEPPVLSDDLAYGEAYGVVPGSALGALFQGEQADLGRRIAETASRIELHADAMQDLALVARVSGPDAAAVEDLGKTLGVALAVGRMQAATGDRTELAELLEHARVERGGDGFSLELALPVEVVERWFEGCGGGAGRAE